MTLDKEINFHNFLGHHTLLYGETDTKKTLITANFIKFLLEEGNIEPQIITVLDFAPSLEIIDNIKIGGKLRDYYDECEKCNYLRFEGEIIPPRLNAKNKRELYQNACSNYKKTSKILEMYNLKPTEILLINDISIYLHLGSKKYLMETINNSKTFFGNSYYGSLIKQNFAKLFSLKERVRVNYIISSIECAFSTQ